jgi:phosphohistidine phosphatase
MKIYVMRHAQASFSAPSDRERPITELGIIQTKALLSANSDQFSDVNLIWSSDLLRAKQTASLVSDALKLEANEQLFLSPDSDVKQVVDALQGLDPNTCLLIVSHQPLVGELVSFLIKGNVHHAHPYTTSEILELELDFVDAGMASLVKQYLPVN